MSINAVKGVNIGAGMSAASLSGEQNSDEMLMSSGKLKFIQIKQAEFLEVFHQVNKLQLRLRLNLLLQF